MFEGRDYADFYFMLIYFVTLGNVFNNINILDILLDF